MWVFASPAKLSWLQQLPVDMPRETSWSSSLPPSLVQQEPDGVESQSSAPSLPPPGYTSAPLGFLLRQLLLFMPHAQLWPHLGGLFPPFLIFTPRLGGSISDMADRHKGALGLPLEPHPLTHWDWPWPRAHVLRACHSPRALRCLSPFPTG